MDVKFSPMDVVNVKPDDALRLLSAHIFDVMSVQIGSVARDAPFFEGIALTGVSTNVGQLRKAMEAFRPAFDVCLQENFKAKALTLWPFGPQVISCNKGDPKCSETWNATVVCGMSINRSQDRHHEPTPP